VTKEGVNSPSCLPAVPPGRDELPPRGRYRIHYLSDRTISYRIAQFTNTFYFTDIMARSNLNIYHRGGGGGNALPSSYRNKALLIIAATALYTAFLYHSGMF